MRFSLSRRFHSMAAARPKSSRRGGSEVAGGVADGGDGVVEGFHEAGDGVAAGRGEVVEEHGVHAGAGEHLADFVVEPDGEASGFDFAGVLEVAGKAAQAGGLGAEGIGLGADAVVGSAQQDDDEGEEGGEEAGGGAAAGEKEAENGLVFLGQIDGEEEDADDGAGGVAQGG